MSTNSPPVVKRILQEAIYYHLDHHLLNNALFFAERLAAFDPHSLQSRFLLGSCHFRLGHYHSAVETLKPSTLKTPDLGCTWIYAQCCFALKKHKHGVSALEKSKSLWPQTTRIGRSRPSVRGISPDRAALLCLLGKLYRELDDTDKAAHHFESALKLNPFMWDAFTNLCDMGVVVSVPNVFNVTDSLVQSFDSAREGGCAGTISDTTNSPLRKSSFRDSSKDKDVPGNVGVNHQTLRPAVRVAGRSATELDDAKPTVSATAALKLDAGELSASLPPLEDSHPPRNAQPDIFRDSVRKARRQVTELASNGVLPRMARGMGSKKNSKKEGRVNDGEQQRIQDTPRDSGPSVTPTKGRKRLRSEDRHQGKLSGVEEAGPTRPRGAALISSGSSTSQMSDIQPESHNAPNTCPPRASKKARRLLPRLVHPTQNECKAPNTESHGNRNRRQRSEESGGDAGKSRTPARQNWIVKPLPLMEKKPDAPKSTDASLRWTLNLLKSLGTGYYALSRFQCEKALKAYNQLSHDQEQTPWVLGQMGRAYFEQGSYHQAEKVFRELRARAPTRHRDMEIYSTVLWHLERHAELSFLAHELLDLSWHSPEA